MQHAGFSMVEILITMAISAVALMGAALLSVQALKLNQGARYRGQAVMMSNDIAERIEANKTAATAGAYALAENVTLTAAKDCRASPCTAGELASYDLADWVSRLSQSLPGASWTITQVAAGNPATYQIAVSWLDRGVGQAGGSTPKTERFSFTTSKTVYR